MCGAFVLSFELTVYVDENDLHADPSATLLKCRPTSPRVSVQAPGREAMSPLRRPLEMCEAPLVCPCLVPA